MGNAKSKWEKELREKDMEERRRRQGDQRKRVEEAEERERQDAYQKLIILTLQASCRGYLARKEYDRLKSVAVRRSKIASEILSTEQSYVKSLKVLMEYFYQPLYASALVQESRHIRAFAKNKTDSLKTKDDLETYYANKKNGSNPGTLSSSELHNGEESSRSGTSTPRSGATSPRSNTTSNFKTLERNGSSGNTSEVNSQNASQNNTLRESSPSVSQSSFKSPWKERRMTVANLTLEDVEQDNVTPIPGLTREDVKRIFNQVEVIANYNENISAQLEKRVAQWVWTSRMGDIFLEMTDFLKVYIQYVNNYNNSQAVIEKLSKVPEFQQWLTDTEHLPEVGGTTIGSFLITPIQRIPRYVLLLEDMVRFTPPNHLDYSDLSEALNKVKEVAKLINEKKREAERFQELLELYNRLEPTQEDLCEAHRHLVFDATLKEEGTQLHVFLFNDIILFTKERGAKKLKVIERLSLNENMHINNLADDKTLKIKNGFQLVNGSGGAKSFKAKSPEEKEQWLQHFQTTIEEYKKKISSFSSFSLKK